MADEWKLQLELLVARRFERLGKYPPAFTVVILMDRWAELFGRILAIYFNLRWVSCHLLFFMDFFFRPKQGTLDSFNENLDSSHDFWSFFLFLISFRSFRLNAYSLLFRWLSYIHFFFFFAIWLWREMNIFIGTSDLRECWSSWKTDSRNIILKFFLPIFLNFSLTDSLFPFRSTHLWLYFGSLRSSRQDIIPWSSTTVAYLGCSW